MREKWNNFKNSEIKYFESMKLTEYRNVFNKDFNEDIIKSPSKINTYDDDSNILNVFNNSGNKNSNKQGSNEKNTNKISLKKKKKLLIKHIF